MKNNNAEKLVTESMFKQGIKNLDGKIKSLDEKFEGLNGKVEGLNGKVEELNGKVEGLNGKVNKLAVGFIHHEERLKNIEEITTATRADVQTILNKIDSYTGELIHLRREYTIHGYRINELEIKTKHL